jgi:putative transposase
MDPNALRIELIDRILRLPADQLAAAAMALMPQAAIVRPQAPAEPQAWPHAPLHRLSEKGTYMLTTGTCRKAHVFQGPDRLTLLESNLLLLAAKYEWHLEAWAVFSNHYHFVGHSNCSPPRLKEFLTELHANTARQVNELDGMAGRQVWHSFWDKQLTFEKSYLARLNYVHQNAVKHGLVPVANQYRWCSAAWFERTARPAQVKTIYGFKTDSLKISDDFEPLGAIG